MTDSGEHSAPPPRVLLLFYSYTGQARKVLDATNQLSSQAQSLGVEVDRFLALVRAG